MAEQFVITMDLADKLRARLADLEERLGALAEERTLLLRQLEAIPLFLSVKSNGAAPASTAEATITEAKAHDLNLGEAVEVADLFSVPKMVKVVLQKGGRLSPVQIREALLGEGVPREKLGPSNSYLYTVLGRLRQTRQVERVRGRYQLPRAG